jgi:hypothetical protein
VNQLQNLTTKSEHCEAQMNSWNRQFHLWQKIHFHVVKDLLQRFVSDDSATSLNSLDTFLQLAKSQHNDITNQMASIIPSVQQLNQRVVRDKSLASEWMSVSRSSSILNGVCGKATTYVMRLKESWQHLMRDRAARGNCIIMFLHVFHD